MKSYSAFFPASQLASPGVYRVGWIGGCALGPVYDRLIV